MAAKVTKRIKIEINDWDIQNKIFQNIHDTMVATFKAEFKSIEDELKAIEKNFTSEKTDEMCAEGEVPNLDPILTLNDKLVIGFTAPLWVPIGLVVGIFALPAAKILALRKKHKQQKALKSMKENLEQHMEALTLSILDEMNESTKLDEALEDKVKELMYAFKKLLDYVPKFIEADRDILNKMKLEVHDRAQQVEQSYRTVYEKIGDVIKDLNCLYLSTIRAYDIDVKDLHSYEYCGEGNFAQVYLAEWKLQKTNPPLCVAIKVMKDPVTRENACDILMEEENLR